MERQTKTVIKIDLIESVSVFSKIKREKEYEIRNLFSKTIREHFPEDSIGSYEGDAYWLIFDSATFSMRKSVIFMQIWENSIAEFDTKLFCRIIIDTGEVCKVDNEYEYTGSPFVNINCIEKHIKSPEIIFTKRTYTIFEKSAFSYREHDIFFNKKTNEKIKTYRLFYDNPRTFKEAALFDATFLMSEEAGHAREKCLTFLIYQSIYESKNRSCSLKHIQIYIREYLMSDVPVTYLRELIENDKNIENEGELFKITGSILDEMEEAKKKYSFSKKYMIDHVNESLKKEGVVIDYNSLGKLIEDLLCSIFGDFKLMANYAKISFIHIDINPKELYRHERVFKKYLSEKFDNDYDEYHRIESYVIDSLKNLPNQCEFFIASVFHNILGSFYLNKKEDFFIEQQKRLKNLTLYLDTNILLSYIFENANNHEKVKYIIEQCRKRGIKLLMFYRTCQEYDNHLKYVNDLYNCYKQRNRGYEKANYILSTKRYPVYMEFIENPSKYNQLFKVCVEAHAISNNIFYSKNNEIDDYSFLEKEGINVDKSKTCKTKDAEYEKKVSEWRDILSIYKRRSTDTIDSLWDEIERQSGDNYELLINHDIECLLDISYLIDSTGKQIYFLSLDKKLVKAHKEVMRINDIVAVDVDQLFNFLIPFFLNEEKSGHDLLDSATLMLKTHLGVFLTAFPVERDELIKLLSSISVTAEMIYGMPPKRIDAILKTLQLTLLDQSKRKEMKETLDEKELNLIDSNKKLIESLVKVRNLEKKLEEEKQEKEILLMKIREYERKK